MIYRTHNLGGLAALLTVMGYYPISKIGLATIVGSLIGNSIGSILPDIDQASNRLWSLVPGGNYTGKIIRQIFISHRSVSHSLVGIGVTYWVTNWLATNLFNSQLINFNTVTVALMIGYVSHIILDGLTEEGVPLFWPIPGKVGIPPIKPWRIKTGKWFEKWVVIPAMVIYLGWWLATNYEKLKNLVLLA